MKFFENLKDRYNFTVLVVAVVFIALGLRMAKLTIVDGDEYRQLAENRKYKEIPITAPRGEIRDRNGRLLAGNTPSFAIQVIKDDIESDGREARNETLLYLTHILSEEGIAYKDEFPIEVNSFRYADGRLRSDEGERPIEEVVSIILEANLIGAILDLNMEYSSDDTGSRFYIGKKAISILESEGISIPIAVNTEGGIEYYFTREDVSGWKDENGISQGADAKSSLIEMMRVKSPIKITRTLINDPISSKLVYDYMSNQGLLGNIVLEDFEFSYEDDYRANKRAMTERFQFITEETSAKDDFINIFEDINGIQSLVGEAFESRGKKVAPAEKLIELLEDKGVDFPYTVEVLDDGRVEFKVKSDRKLRSFQESTGIASDTSAINALIDLGEQYDLIDEFITGEDIKNYAQRVMLRYVNPRISVADWEYSAMVDKNIWLKSNGLEEDISPRDAFYKLLEKNEIDDSLTIYEARNILLVIDELKNLGYQGYYPVNIAYGANEKVIAQIEENREKLLGVNISLEPIRDYPLNESAAHILGYMGPIAQQSEIDRYVDELGYGRNDLIGKTGIEQRFEEYLKGEDGSKRVEVDSLGNVVTEIAEEETVPGGTLYLTIDADLQRVMEESLERGLREIRRGGSFESEWGNYNFGKSYRFANSASAVAIDTQTGEILAMANYPSYDPNLFSTGISDEDWKSLMPKDEKDPIAPRPLFNSAIQTAIQPGSTFKMITGLAALENGIPASKSIYDYGYVDIGSTRFGCWLWNQSRGSHGPTDLYHAIADSCNYYFYSVSLGRVPKTGELLPGKADIEEIMKVAKEFGLGDKTGIEVPGEVARGVPGKETKENVIKALLKNFLNSKIEEYYQEGKQFSDEEKAEIINEIVSWTEHESPLSKSEVVDRLDGLGIEGELRLPGEREDLSDTIKYTYLNQAKWGEADTLNISIGQGENSYTPIQMANYIATIANGGIRHDLSIIDRVESYDNSKIEYMGERASSHVKLNDMDNIAEVAKGMHAATVEGGVASSFVNFPVKVAGKTGTAQREGVNPSTGVGYDNYSWFTAYAPYEEGNPEASKIAVAVMISQGGAGGFSVPIAREIIGEYLNLSEESETEIFDVRNGLTR